MENMRWGSVLGWSWLENIQMKRYHHPDPPGDQGLVSRKTYQQMNNI